MENLHNEISYKNRTLIIDTCVIRFQSGQPVYETMALYAGTGHDLACVVTYSTEQAEKAHAEMLEKFVTEEQERQEEQRRKKAEQAAELPAKYQKLAADLRDALEKTEYLEQTEDGGTCNFDSVCLHLDRWNGEKIEQAAKMAGCRAWKWTWGKRTMGWNIVIPSSEQANRRSRRAEAICKIMQEKGYSAGMYYAMD